MLLLINAMGVDFLCTYALARSSTSIAKTSTHLMKFDKYSPGRRRGVAVSGVRRMNEANPRRARLVIGRVTVLGRVYHLDL